MSRSLERSRSNVILRGCAALMSLAVLLSASGCGDQAAPLGQHQGDEGEISIAIPLSKIAASSIARAEVVITAGDMSRMTHSLTVSADRITGTVQGIPAGTSRLFSLNGYDSGNVLTYSGSATATVTAGQQVTVRIAVRRVSGTAEPPFQVVVRGVPLLQAGLYSAPTTYSEARWSSFPTVGNDARLIGELENAGAESVSGVQITVTFRDMSGNFIGRASSVLVGAIGAGRSEAFEAYKNDIFPDGGLSPRSIEIEITYTGSDGSSLWICTANECSSG